MSKAHQFTSATAPRQGGKAGRKNKLGLDAIKFLEDLYRDYRTHGATAITTMRIEKPEQYIRLMADVSTKLVAPDGESVPPVMMVKWLSSPPLPSRWIKFRSSSIYNPRRAATIVPSGRSHVTRRRPEQTIHRALFQHIAARGVPGLVAFHPANGGYRSPGEAKILAGLG